MYAHVHCRVNGWAVTVLFVPSKHPILVFFCCTHVCMLSHVPLFATPLEYSPPARLLCPWDFPGKTTGVGCHCLVQGTFLSQRSNLCLLPWQADFYP